MNKATAPWKSSVVPYQKQKCQSMVIVPILLLKQCRKIWTNQSLLNGIKNILGEVSKDNGVQFLHCNRIFSWNPNFQFVEPWGSASTVWLTVTYTVP
jgi:hypothetical protein